MGLDVYAYSKIQLLDAVFDERGNPLDPATLEPYEDYFKVYVSRDFPTQAEGLVDRGIYSYVGYDNCWGYGYGSFATWREQLAKLAGYRAVWFQSIPGMMSTRELSYRAGAGAVPEGPFRELLWFTDCEGFIGTKVSAKLAKDFADWDAQARATEDAWFYEHYEAFRRCLELGADGGAVQFT